MDICTGETAELLCQELSDDEGTYQAHDIVFDTPSKGSLTVMDVAAFCLD